MLRRVDNDRRAAVVAEASAAGGLGDRLRAAARDLLACGVLVGLVSAIAFGVWYPGPLPAMLGVSSILWIVIGMDLADLLPAERRAARDNPDARIDPFGYRWVAAREPVSHEERSTPQQLDPARRAEIDALVSDSGHPGDVLRYDATDPDADSGTSTACCVPSGVVAWIRSAGIAPSQSPAYGR